VNTFQAQIKKLSSKVLENTESVLRFLTGGGPVFRLKSNISERKSSFAVWTYTFGDLFDSSWPLYG